MSKFEYTLPSGAKYVVNGPPGATKEQADRIFYEQVAAGSLVGYIPGQTLTSRAVAITKFELSRLDRGTAGVDTDTILSVVNGLPVIAPIPTLLDVPLQDPINIADLATVNQTGLGVQGSIGSDAIGPLDPTQTQALLAQIANLVDQPYDQISYEKGLGKYGFTTAKLEEAGYVKPGTLLRFLSIDPEDFTTVMSSPGIWTGKDGIISLDALLADPEQQTMIQTQLMQNAYVSLQASGAISPPASLAATLATGYIFYQGGLQAATRLTSLVSDLGLKLGNDGILRVTNDVQTTITKLLNAPNNLANLDIKSITSGAVNSLTSGLNQLTNLNISNLAANITNNITGGVGALVANASKFGTDIATAWSTGSLGSLANIGNLGSLTANLDIFGKMSQYAVNFTNPLGSFNLSNLNLGNLGGLNLSSLGNLGGLNLSSLGNLGGLNLSSLGNLGGLNLSSLGNLGGLNLSSLGNLGNLLGGLGNLGSIGSIFGGGGSSLVSATQFAGGFTNTVNRATVDSAVTRILGNAKIPSPTFEFPSASSLLGKLDIAQAKTILSGLSNPSSLLTSNQTFASVNNSVSGVRGSISTFNRLLG